MAEFIEMEEKHEGFSKRTLELVNNINESIFKIKNNSFESYQLSIYKSSAFIQLFIIRTYNPNNYDGEDTRLALNIPIAGDRDMESCEKILIKFLEKNFSVDELSIIFNNRDEIYNTVNKIFYTLEKDRNIYLDLYYNKLKKKIEDLKIKNSNLNIRIGDLELHILKLNTSLSKIRKNVWYKIGRKLRLF